MTINDDYRHVFRAHLEESVFPSTPRRLTPTEVRALQEPVDHHCDLIVPPDMEPEVLALLGITPKEGYMLVQRVDGSLWYGPKNDQTPLPPGMIKDLGLVIHPPR